MTDATADVPPAPQQEAPPQYKLVTVPETSELKYLRQTRNATVFIAWALGIGIALAIAWGIVAAMNAAAANSVNQQVNNICQQEGC